MLPSQHVNIGLMPWSHLSNTAAHADSHSDGQYVQLCLAAQLRLRLWLSPYIPTAPLAASFWKYAPVGYIPAHFSADPAVSGPAGPSLTLSACSSSWWRPLTWSNWLGLLTFHSSAIYYFLQYPGNGWSFPSHGYISFTRGSENNSFHSRGSLLIQHQFLR